MGAIHVIGSANKICIALFIQKRYFCKIVYMKHLKR